MGLELPRETGRPPPSLPAGVGVWVTRGRSAGPERWSGSSAPELCVAGEAVLPFTQADRRKLFKIKKPGAGKRLWAQRKRLDRPPWPKEPCGV